MGNIAREGYEIRYVFVAVVEVVGNFAGCWEKDERTCGDGLRGLPDVGLEEGVISATELLDTEIVVVDEALEGLLSVLYRAHFDAAAHAVESHRNRGVTLFQ